MVRVSRAEASQQLVWGRVMAVESRLIRLFRLLETLGTGRPQNASLLAEICNVSRRTVFRDISTLQEAGVHVNYDAEKQGYFLKRPNFLRPTDLTLEETLSLIVMGTELGNSQSGLMFCDHVRTAAMKLACNLPERLREAVGHVTESIMIQVGSNGATDDERKNFDVIRSGLAEHRCVRLQYDSVYDRSVIGTKFSPYRVLFSRREWYAIGRSSLHRSVRTFKIRRIQSAELLEDRFEVPPRFNVERYLGNAWHLIRDKSKPAHVVLRFRPLVARNVAEVTWHKTQRMVWLDDGSLEMHVDVEGLSEISWWVLGYGDQVEVVEPGELRRMLAVRVGELVQMYRREIDESSSSSGSSLGGRKEKAAGKDRTGKRGVGKPTARKSGKK